jgi:hypothetical protein
MNELSLEQKDEAVRLLRVIAFETCSEDELFAALRQARYFFGEREPGPRRKPISPLGPRKRRARRRKSHAKT